MATQEEQTPARPSKCVLVVDDAAVIRRLLRGLVEGSGHRPVEAKGGQEALDYAELDPPDLIILDVQMPAMGGLETLKAFRQNPRFKMTPVILLTGDRDAQTVRQGLTERITDYIVKDDPGGVVQRLRKHLESL